MGDDSGIEWTDATWNPLTGCTKVSEGCRNCYAIRMARRMDGQGVGYDGTTTGGPNWSGQINLLHERLDQPLRWTKPRRVFVNSMSDLFHPDVPTSFIDKVWGVMAASPEHIFQVLTKRPDRMRDYVQDLYRETGRLNSWLYDGSGTFKLRGLPYDAQERAAKVFREEPYPENIWLGTSVEHQDAANERIPALLDCWASVRFLSCEPLLGEVNIYEAGHPHGVGAGLEWVIVGGESGPGARPMHPDWVRSLLTQCRNAGTDFFFKQWGAWAPNGTRAADTHVFEGGPMMHRVGKKAAGRSLYGKEYNEMPAKLKEAMLDG